MFPAAVSSVGWSRLIARWRSLLDHRETSLLGQRSVVSRFAGARTSTTGVPGWSRLIARSSLLDHRERSLLGQGSVGSRLAGAGTSTTGVRVWSRLIARWRSLLDHRGHVAARSRISGFEARW